MIVLSLSSSLCKYVLLKENEKKLYNKNNKFSIIHIQ